MSPDPFRIQLLTIGLDSQVVLTVVGLLAAGLVFRLAARRAGFDLRAGDWWDIATAAVVGARLVWVATHLDYYLRGPLQVLVIVDGGLHPVGLVLGAAYGIRRLREHEAGASWRELVDLVALGAVTVFLAERVGCALTTCGAGPETELPWALRRGTEWREPVALEQLVVLSVALALMAELRAVPGIPFAVALVAFTLVELIGLMAGSRSFQGLLGLAATVALYAVATVRAGAGPAGLARAARPAVASVEATADE